MAAIALDPLEYARALEAAGVPREQAEVHAKAMTANFAYNMDALVTRDYLDVRLSELEIRFEAKMDRRFADVDSRIAALESTIEGRFTDMASTMDHRFSDMASTMERRFTGMESTMERRFTAVASDTDRRFAGVDVRLARINLLLGIILAAVAVPVLQAVLVWIR